MRTHFPAHLAGPAVLGLFFLAAASSPRAQPTVDGPVFRVDGSTSGTAVDPSIAQRANGGFTVAWDEDRAGPGGSTGISSRSGTGADVLGPQAPVALPPPFWILDADVALQPGGIGLVTWWAVDRGPETSKAFLRRVSATGAIHGAPVELNSEVGVRAIQPDVLALPDPGFLVSWGEGTSYGWSDRIMARRFQLNGDPSGASFRVDVSEGDQVTSPTAATAGEGGGGGFVVVWASTRNDATTENDLLARRFGADAVPLGGEFQVNHFTTGFQLEPRVEALSDGGFLVAWASDFSPEDASLSSVQVRRFASSGAAIGTELQVNTAITGAQVGVTLATGRDGELLAVWEDQGVTPSTLQARALSAVGVPVGGTFQVEDESDDLRGFPVVASSGIGDFVVAWSQSRSTDDAYGKRDILLRRIAATPPIFDDGFEQQFDGWDEVIP